MILLQAVVDATTTWRTYLQDAYQFAQIVGTIFVIIYVIYTYKTFRQIKKQTDYQQDAYLRVEPTILKEISSPKMFQAVFQLVGGQMVPANDYYSLKYIQKDLHDKLKGILKPIFNFEDALFDGNYYTLNLTNYGNAEVIKINLSLEVEIKNAKELVDKKMLKEKEIHKVILTVDEIVGRNGGQIKLPILATAAFPIYSISLTGTYTDVRNKTYVIPTTITQGANEHFHKLT